MIVLTRSASRLEHLWQAARAEVEQDRWEYYLFATFEILKPGMFADDVWLDLDGDKREGVVE